MNSIEHQLHLHSYWAPHGSCFLWDPLVLWLRVVFGLGITGAYIAIPIGLARLSRLEANVLPRAKALLFAPFILFCGFGHAIDVVTIWEPIYLVQAIWTGVTFLASLPAAYAMSVLVKRIAALPTGEDLAHAVARAAAAEARAEAATERAERATPRPS